MGALKTQKVANVTTLFSSGPDSVMVKDSRRSAQLLNEGHGFSRAVKYSDIDGFSR
jgi:hypothetical protein